MTKPIATAALIVTMATSASASSLADDYTSYFAFGDSLTDNGKFGALAPPSFGGRFSNGITYAEHIAAEFESAARVNFNFAIGGATAGNVNTTPYPAPAAPFGTFMSQVATFDFLDFDLAAGSNPLVSVLFGANDIFQNLATDPDAGTKAADAVSAGIKAIAALGSNFDDFVVSNIPDLSQIPRFAGKPAEALAKIQSEAFNAQLAANLQTLRDDEGLTIFEVDLDGFLKEIIADPDTLDIENVTDACTSDLFDLIVAGNCSFTGTGFDITLADKFLFVDPVHPNRVAQRAFADELRAAVNPAPVPLPAALPLMLVGMGVFAFGARRQRQARG